jgi:hypothetical protein
MRTLSVPQRAFKLGRALSTNQKWNFAVYPYCGRVVSKPRFLIGLNAGAVFLREVATAGGSVHTIFGEENHFRL